MKVPILAVVGLVVLALLAFLVRPHAPDSSLPEHSSSTPGGKSVARLPTEVDSSDGPSSARSALAPSPAAEQPIPAHSLAPGMRRLAGKVVFPDGTPLDEKVVVIAADRESSSNTQRGEVAPDGRFALDVPERWRRAWFRLEAKYLYLDDRLESVKRSLDVPLVLEAKLGGRIEFELAPTSNAALPMDRWAGRRVTVEAREQTSPGSSSSVFERKNTIDAGLHCAMGGLPATWTYALRWQRGSVWFRAREERNVRPGTTVRVEIPAFAEARVRGTLLDEAGEYVPESRWQFTWKSELLRGETLEGWATTPCDLQGRFDMDGLPPGEIDLKIMNEEFLPVCWNSGMLREGEDRRGVALVLARGLCIRGKVEHPDGSPVAKCTVHLSREERDRAWSRCDPYENQECVTDGDGSFSICGLDPGPWTIEARLDALPRSTISSSPKSPPSAASAHAEGVAGGTNNLVLVLDDGVAITGSVVDDEEKPVPHFRLRALHWAEDRTPAGPDGFWSDVKPWTFDSPTGEFTLSGLRPGRWSLGLEAQGFSAQSIGPIRVPASAPLRLVVARRASIRGRVLDPSGSPATEARVHMDRVSSDSLNNHDDSMERGIQVKQDGSFAIERVEPGAHRIWATCPGTAGSASSTVEVAAGSSADGTVLRLRVGGTIAGRILDEQGKPAAGWRVLCSGPGRSMMERVSADAGGEFVIEHCAPGRFEIRAFPPEEKKPKGGSLESGRNWAAKVEVSDGETRRVTLGDMQGTLARVEGLVTRGGTASAGSAVSAQGPGIGQWKRTTTNDAGRFTLELTWSGATRISVQPRSDRAGSLGCEVRAEAGATVRADFELPAAVVRGRVLDPEGRPAERALVLLATSDSSSPTRYHCALEADQDGAFVFESVPAGSCKLTAAPPSLAGSNRRASWSEVRQRIDVHEGQSIDGLVLRLGWGGTLTGVVVDAHGLQVRGARLGAFDAQGQSLDGDIGYKWSNKLTDGQGRFEVLATPTEEIQVFAISGTRICAPVSVRMHEGETVDIRLEITSGTRLLLRSPGISTPEFTGPGTLELRDASGRDWIEPLWMDTFFAESDDGGGPGIRIGPLPRGRYALTRRDGLGSYGASVLVIDEAGLLPVDLPTRR